MGKVTQIFGDNVFVNCGEEEYKVLSKDDFDYEVKVGDEVDLDKEGNLIKESPKDLKDIPELIKKYKELLDMGAITQEEYDSQKKKLLK